MGRGGELNTKFFRSICYAVLANNYTFYPHINYIMPIIILFCLNVLSNVLADNLLVKDNVENTLFCSKAVSR